MCPIRPILCAICLTSLVCLGAVERQFGPYVSPKKGAEQAQQQAPQAPASDAERMQEQLSQAAPLPDRIVPLGEGSRAIDHRRLASWDGPEPARKAAIDALGVLLAQMPGDTDLASGLEALAAEDPERFSYRESRSPTQPFLRNGGLGRVLVGTRRKPESRIGGFADRFGRADLGDEADVALLGMHADDISPGRTVEYTTTVYRVRLDIRTYRVSLADVHTENINAVSNQNGALVQGGFPLELPNMEVAGLSTSVLVPAGGGTRMSRAISPRFPGIAFAFYRDTMEALEKAYPDSRLAWSTVPLREGENLQANLYNTMVREHAAANDKLLFDIAAIQSHEADGQLAVDSQGPVLASSWRAERGGDRLNEPGRKRLAKAWWALLDQVAAERQ